MLDRLEKKYGKYAIKNLIYYILGAYVIGYILYMAKPEWYEYIVLYPSLVMKGQVWRLFTWVCTAPQNVSILLIFMFLFYFFIGRTLEKFMGAFKYNLYILSGWFFTTLGAMIYYWVSHSDTISMTISTNYLNLTSFLAFAVIFPDTRVLLFAIIPIRMKVLAWIDAIYLGLQVLSGFILAVAPDKVVRQALEMYYGYPPMGLEVMLMKSTSIALMITILISFMNFFLFFYGVMKVRTKNKKRKADFYSRMNQGRQQANANQRQGAGFTTPFRKTSGNEQDNSQEASENAGSSQQAQKPKYRADNSHELVHTCSVCGRTNITNPELMFRYCSKCAGNHEYCQDHLFTHVHVQ